MYKSFTIENFRGFKNFKINNLKRVNLLTGLNNVGKTSLLEALFIHGGSYNPHLTLRINAFRGFESLKVEGGKWNESPWDSIFYQYNIINEVKLEGYDHKLVKRTLRLSTSNNTAKIDSNFLKLKKNEHSDLFPDIISTSDKDHILTLSYQEKNKRNEYKLILDSKGIQINPTPPNPPFPTYFISTRLRISFSDMSEKYGRLEKIGKHKILINALKLIEPKLKRLSTIVEFGEPIIHGEVDVDRLFPLPIMGEGMVRLANFVLHIGNAPNGVVLIDEIENGLHYTTFINIWEVIEKVTKAFNTQLFASTHSFECIKAAHEAFSNTKDYDFCLIRLDKIKEKIIPTSYDQKTLNSAIETGFEVR